LLGLALTPGNIDDRKPVPKLVRKLFGKLFGDKGYLSQPLFEELLRTFNIRLITKLKKGMRNRLLPLADKLLLRKRAIVETVMVQRQMENHPIWLRDCRNWRFVPGLCLARLRMRGLPGLARRGQLAGTPV